MHAALALFADNDDSGITTQHRLLLEGTFGRPQPASLQSSLLVMSAEELFKPRRYFHFDEPATEAVARRIATSPSVVCRWAFLPMLKCIVRTEKVKWNEQGQLQKIPKDRPICYSCHKDAAIYAYYGSLLTNEYEQLLKARGLSEIVTAFRPKSGKCNIHFAKEVFDWIRSKEECTALAFDIKSFFDTLDHKILKRHWSALLGEPNLPPDHYAVFKSLTKFSWVLRDHAFLALGISKHKPRAKKRRCLCTIEEFRVKIRDAGLISKNTNPFGIPQGSGMSAVLSNIYMIEFDSAVAAKVREIGGLYRRYCDDMLCVVPTESASEIEAFVMREIEKVELEIQSKKTMRHHFSNGALKSPTTQPLQYLGFLFDGSRVLLRNAGLSRYYSRMRAAARLAVASKAKVDGKAKQPPPPNPVRRKKINTRYSYLGGRNFVSYALRAAREFDAPSIKRQVRRHWRKLNSAVSKAETKTNRHS